MRAGSVFLGSTRREIIECATGKYWGSDCVVGVLLGNNSDLQNLYGIYGKK
jgi:hypothetical protein